MTQKYHLDNYVICVTFRNEFSLSMVVSLPMTNEHFENNSIELGKIKKDTVEAAFGRKNQKTLSCKFEMVDSDPRKLVVSIIVDFDYLPKFQEDIVLDQIEVKDGALNQVSSLQFQTDISQLDTLLESLKTNGSIKMTQKSGSSNSNPFEVIEVQKGSYLLEVTGHAQSTTNTLDELEFTLSSKDAEPVKFNAKINCQYGYVYPYCKRIKINSKCEQEYTLKVRSTTGSTVNISNHITSLVPIIQVK